MRAERIVPITKEREAGEATSAIVFLKPERADPLGVLMRDTAEARNRIHISVTVEGQAME